MTRNRQQCGLPGGCHLIHRLEATSDGPPGWNKLLTPRGGRCLTLNGGLPLLSEGLTITPRARADDDCVGRKGMDRLSQTMLGNKSLFASFTRNVPLHPIMNPFRHPHNSLSTRDLPALLHKLHSAGSRDHFKYTHDTR
jgi:hypothetical protein